MVKDFMNLPQKRGYNVALITLDWLNNQGVDVFQIPCNKTSKRIEETPK